MATVDVKHPNYSFAIQFSNSIRFIYLGVMNFLAANQPEYEVKSNQIELILYI